MRPQVVIDTNVLLAGLRSRTGASAAIIALIFEDVFDIHISLPVFIQYRDVVAREPESLLLPAEEVAVLLDRLERVGYQHDVHYLWRPLLSDPGDDAVLELAVVARAKYIITFNARHFRGCESFGITAIKPLELLRLLEDIK